MMGGIFGSLHPFFEGGDVNGRKMANAGFMAALLELDPFEHYEFFVGNPDALRDELERRGNLSAVRRGAIRCRYRTDLPDALRNTRYHVFHFSDPVTEYVALCQARNLYAPELFPVTAVNHSINYKEYAGFFLAHMWPGCTARDALGANSTAAVGVLRGWFSHLRQAYGLDPALFPGPRLKAVPMGVEPVALPRPDPERRASMRARLGLEEDSIAVLLFGRMAVDDKLDPQPLLPALRRARTLNPAVDLHLVVSGFVRHGDPTPELLRVVGHMLHAPLHVLPNPTPEEKLALYAAADIFVSPSDNIQETFGLSLLEAGAAALPAVVSDWNGYRDIVVPEVTGLRIPTLAPAATESLDDLAPVIYDNQHQYLRAQQTVVDVPALAAALHRLGSDAALRRRMGSAARARVLEGFTCEAVVRRWLAFWEELRATPVPPDAEQRVRAARHPFRLPFGQVFAPYATEHPTPVLTVCCTEMGHALRMKRVPLSAFGKPVGAISEEVLRPMLVLARKPVNLSTLEQRLLSPEHAACFPDAATVRTCVLWALKHDLLERTASQKAL